MAIVDGVPGLKVEIINDGNPLQEYDAKTLVLVGGTQQTQCYVEAVDDTKFAFRYAFDPNFPFYGYTLKMRFFFDGSEQARIFDLNMFQRTTGKTKDISGARFYDETRKQYYMQPFVFKGLNIVESAESIVQQRNDNLGMLKVTIHRVIRKSSSRSGTGTKSLSESNLDHLISEKMLKNGDAVSHQVGYGEPSQIRPYNTTKVNYIDDEDSPLASFEFRYRSNKSLKDLEIIPRTPSPPPIEEQNLTEMSPADLLRAAVELQERLRAADSNVVKKEEPLDIVKRERIHEDGMPDDDDDIEFVSTTPAKRKREDGTEERPVEID